MMTPMRALLATLATYAVLSCGPDPNADAAKIRINELMPANTSTIVDENGVYDDWVELYNGGSKEVDLEGYYMSDTSSDYFQRRLPAGLKIGADSVLMLWADGSISGGILHLPFKLSSVGEDIYLTSPDGKQIDSYQWTSAVADQSFARFPDGTGAFIVCASPTPNAKNGAACGQ